jgi:4-amino-4-deoxy-L-arabinose transferase-like glycosyltransferase
MLRRHSALIVILAIAVAVRVAYIPAHQTLLDATVTSGELARNIVDHGRWFETNNHAIALVKELREREHRFINPAEVNFTAVDAKPQWQPYIVAPVGPSVVLAGVWKLTGSERYIYGEIAQIVVDSLMVLFVYRIALLLFKRRRASLVAAALYAIYPPIAQQTSIVGPDIWSVDFTIAIVAVYLEAMHSSHRLRLLVLCGVIVGVSAYFRPNLLIIPSALALASARRGSWRPHVRNAAIATGIAALLLVPWTIRNYDVFHRFIPTRTGLGVTLWVGLSEVHNSYGIVGNEEQIYAEVHRVRPDLVYSSPAYDAYLRTKALHVIEEHPLYYAKLVARRILLSTVGEYESGWMRSGGESPFRYRALTGHGLFSYLINRPFDVLQDALQPVVFLLGMLALALTWPRRRREHVILIAVVLTTLVPYWIIHSETRYVLPASLAYIIWMALGADLLADRVVDRLRMRAVRGVSRAESVAHSI